MADVKSAFACALCKKQFSNPLFLIKHVDLRHPTASSSKNDEFSEQTSIKIAVPDEKGTETINTVSLENSLVIENEAQSDTLETIIDDENTNHHFQLVDINEILRYEQ